MRKNNSHTLGLTQLTNPKRQRAGLRLAKACARSRSEFVNCVSPNTFKRIASTTILLTLCCLPRQVLAEGGGKRPTGDNGANRRVRTTSGGYSEVEGTVDISFKLPTDKRGKVTSSTNPKNDIPSVYLGGIAGKTEYDGGLEYQWDRVPNRVNGIYYDPGWSAFMSVNGVYTNPQVWTGSISEPWRSDGLGSTGQIGTGRIVSDLRFTFHTPKTAWVSLYVGAMPKGEGGSEWSFYYNPPLTPAGIAAASASASHPTAPYIGEARRRYTSLEDSSVKRVVAVTRNSPTAKYPNLWLSGTTIKSLFSNGRVRKIHSPWDFWGPSDVLQKGTAATGYDAPGGTSSDAVDMVPGGIPAKGKTPSPGFRTIIQFPKLNVSNKMGRMDSSQSEQARENGVSRYRRETVWINLRAAAKKRGNKKK